jgi:hypothetical protein
VRRPEAGEAVVASAAAWLWAQQDPDGAWRSETYGLLASGQSLTPFVLEALLEVPADVCRPPAGALTRALEAIRLGVGDDGLCGLADPEAPEYPVYTTAHALRCLLRVGAPEDEVLALRLADALLTQQLGPDLSDGHPAAGGWGFGLRPPGHPGHMDVCHTRHVLEALQLAGRVDPDVRAGAEEFLAFVQRHPSDRRPQPPGDDAGQRGDVPYDGGFYFSPVVQAASKGGVGTTEDGTRYLRSYASATCDGVLALLAAGVPRFDERVVAAAGWLRRRSRLDVPEGIPDDDPSGWAQAVHFTHLASRAKAWNALGGPSGWRGALAAHLAELQREDGSFANAGAHLMKEDDPLLCTGLALLAAAHTLD